MLKPQGEIGRSEFSCNAVLFTTSVSPIHTTSASCASTKKLIITKNNGYGDGGATRGRISSSLEVDG